MSDEGVEFQREDHKEHLPKWQLASDVCEGEKKVKSKGITYLPQPNPKDKSEENEARFEQYLTRAVFYNATGRTLQGLIGAAYRKMPVLEAPGFDYLEQDIDGQGLSIFQQSQSTLEAVLKRGRHALLVDYPATNGNTSKADQNALAIRATVASISAEAVINWRTEQIGGRRKLTLVVIKESYETVNSDGFGVEVETQYRVLRLLDGAYQVEVWRNTKAGWEIFEVRLPTDSSGNLWTEIPFTFVGSNNNDPHIDQAPLYDLATLNLGHYRNSADYEDSVFLTGQPQPWMSGFDANLAEQMKQAGVYIGSRQLIGVPDGQQFAFAVAPPNPLVRQAMLDKQEQMVGLGARLVQPGTAVKTATEAQGEIEAEHSVLSLAASNVSDAYTKCLNWMAQFNGVAGEQSFALSQDFMDGAVNAETMKEIREAVMAGLLPARTYHEAAQKRGLVDDDSEYLQEEIDAQLPGLDLEDV